MTPSQKQAYAWEYVKEYIKDHYPHLLIVKTGSEEMKSAINEALESLLIELEEADA